MREDSCLVHDLGSFLKSVGTYESCPILPTARANKGGFFEGYTCFCESARTGSLNRFSRFPSIQDAFLARDLPFCPLFVQPLRPQFMSYKGYHVLMSILSATVEFKYNTNG